MFNFEVFYVDNLTTFSSRDDGVAISGVFYTDVDKANELDKPSVVYAAKTLVDRTLSSRARITA